MKRLVPIPCGCAEHLKNAEETGIGYQVVSVQLKDARIFEQVVISEGCSIEVRGCKEIPFSPDDVASVSVNHKLCNFSDQYDTRVKSRSATAYEASSPQRAGIFDGKCRKLQSQTS